MSAGRVGRLGSIAVVAAMLAACFEEGGPAGPTTQDGGAHEPGPPDSAFAELDSGAPVDTDAGVDASQHMDVMDAGTVDPIDTDGGDTDAGDIDPGEWDAAVEDDGGIVVELDSGAPDDSGPPDSGPPDSGPPDSGPPLTVDFDSDVVPILLARCGPCHTERMSGGVTFGINGATAYSSLVGVASTRAGCDTIRVVPGDFEASLLYRKLANVGLTGCGNPMPRTSQGWTAIPAGELDIIVRWIAEGANP